jgi:predicted dehydrogenase
MLTWDVYSGEVRRWSTRDQPAQLYEFGAIGTVLDAGYAEEINTFVDAVHGEKSWPQSYAQCQEATAILAAAEKSSATRQWVKVDPDAEPSRYPPNNGAFSSQE